MADNSATVGNFRRQRYVYPSIKSLTSMQCIKERWNKKLATVSASSAAGLTTDYTP